MLKRVFTGLWSGVLAALRPACDGINLGKLKPGISTVHDVRASMGPPSMEWCDADGSMTWEYPRMPQGLVNYMLDFAPDKRLREVRQVLSEANFARIVPGMTRDDVRRRLGRSVREQHFALKKEYAWEWRTKSESGYDYFFDVYFDESGRVTRTGAHMNALGG